MTSGSYDFDFRRNLSAAKYAQMHLLGTGWLWQLALVLGGALVIFALQVTISMIFQKIFPATGNGTRLLFDVAVIVGLIRLLFPVVVSMLNKRRARFAARMFRDSTVHFKIDEEATEFRSGQSLYRITHSDIGRIFMDRESLAMVIAGEIFVIPLKSLTGEELRTAATKILNGMAAEARTASLKNASLKSLLS